MNSFANLSRKTLRSLLLLVTLGLPSWQVWADETKYLLRHEQPAPQVSQAQVVVEVSGNLHINADGKQVIRLPLTAQGEFVYEEMWLTSDVSTSSDSAGKEMDAVSLPRRAIRHYSKAEAHSRIGERDVVNRLAADRRLIAVYLGEPQVHLFSPAGSLTRDELELIDLQGSSTLLPDLLPADEVTVGQTWTHDDNLVAKFLGLDLVTENKLQSLLHRVDANVAYLQLSGAVTGSVAGVSSTIQVTGKYNVDVSSKRLQWLALSLQEKREIGHAEPGFEVTARIRAALTPVENSTELVPEFFADLPREVNSGMTCLAFHSTPGAFRMLHDRPWRVMIDRKDVTILRLIDRGELIAQCNITRLPDAAPGKQLILSAFQADIQRALDKNFGQFAETTESKTEKGLRQLRCIVAGVAADLPIQWNYYHLTDDQGRQASLVFTMDAKLVERFAAADQILLSTFEFVESAGETKSPAKVAQGDPDAAKPAEKR